MEYHIHCWPHVKTVLTVIDQSNRFRISLLSSYVPFTVIIVIVFGWPGKSPLPTKVALHWWFGSNGDAAYNEYEHVNITTQIHVSCSASIHT